MYLEGNRGKEKHHKIYLQLSTQRFQDKEFTNFISQKKKHIIVELFIEDMRQVLRTSLNQMKCVLTGHTVDLDIEDELFRNPTGFLNTKCSRCNYPLRLRKDPTDKEENTYMLTERD